MTVNFKPIDIRISTLPSVHGEKIVMRILDLSTALNKLEKMGFTDENESTFRNMISRPNGIDLMTGPTGSGKAKTVYAALNLLNEDTGHSMRRGDHIEHQRAEDNK